MRVVLPFLLATLLLAAAPLAAALDVGTVKQIVGDAKQGVTDSADCYRGVLVTEIVPYLAHDGLIAVKTTIAQFVAEPALRDTGALQDYLKRGVEPLNQCHAPALP